MTVGMRAALPDDVGAISRFVAELRTTCALLVVTGGLGGTPDDVTREAVAEAFGVRLVTHPDAWETLRGHFPDRVDGYVERFAMLPAGACPVVNPLGGAPCFRLENVLVLAGVPAEMEATFEAHEPELRDGHGGEPIQAVRLSFATTEADIVTVLERASAIHPAVAVGSYPHFDGGRKRVDVVLKSKDGDALAAAASWLGDAVGEVLKS